MLIGIAVSFVGKACRSSEYVLSIVEVISLQFSLNGNILLLVLKKKRQKQPTQKVKTATDKLLISFIVLLMHVWHLHSDTEFSFCFLCNRLLCYLTTNKMPAASQGWGYSSPHSTIPQVLLPWGLSPPAETSQSVLRRRRIYLELQSAGYPEF